MNEPSALGTDAVDRAASAIEAMNLRVLDRDWAFGRHHLDLVATPGGDILAAVEVRVTGHGTTGACVAALTEARFQQATDAGRAWMRQHGSRYEDLWVVLVTVDPDRGVRLVTGNAAEVG